MTRTLLSSNNRKDSFTGQECSQYSIAFEKASVIYNLGAICSSIAALQNRYEAEGLRIAFNYFQASAGLFAFINENFLHAPSVDMSRDSIKTLTELMLAQAQECFLEKVTFVDKKMGNLASKLCAQLAFMYLNVLDGLCLESISGQFDRAWVELIRVFLNQLKVRLKVYFLLQSGIIIVIYSMKWITSMEYL
jgi:hypothetical protein